MRVIYGLLFLAAAAACNKATTEADDPLTGSVIADASTFQPGNVVIQEGGTVEFTFGSTAHEVIFTEQPGRPVNIEPAVDNRIEKRTFATAGTYSYKCSLTNHGVMEGTVTVRPSTPPALAP